MNRGVHDRETASDRELADRARRSDAAAVAELYARHRQACLALARSMGESDEAEDCVADAFASVLRQFARGGGPGDNVRAYLLTAVRHEVYRRTKARHRIRPTSDVQELDSTVAALDDPRRLEQQVAMRAWDALPERWRAVLWALDVDGLKPQQVADQLQMRANAVSALAYRARSALREAYLAEHLPAVAELPRECRRVRGRLPALVRGNLTARREKVTTAHLQTCAACDEVAASLREENRWVAAWAGVPIIALAGGSQNWSIGVLLKGGLGLSLPPVAVGSSMAAFAVFPLVFSITGLSTGDLGAPAARHDGAARHPQAGVLSLGAVPRPPAERPDVADGAPTRPDVAVPTGALPGGPPTVFPAVEQDAQPGPRPGEVEHSVGDSYGPGYVVTAVDMTGSSSVQSQRTYASPTASHDPSIVWTGEEITVDTITYRVTAEETSGAFDVVCGEKIPHQKVTHYSVTTRTVVRTGTRTDPSGRVVAVRDAPQVAEIERAAWTSWAGPPPTRCSGDEPSRPSTVRVPGEDQRGQHPAEPEPEPEPEPEVKDGSETEPKETPPEDEVASTDEQDPPAPTGR